MVKCQKCGKESKDVKERFAGFVLGEACYQQVIDMVAQWINL